MHIVQIHVHVLPFCSDIITDFGSYHFKINLTKAILIIILPLIAFGIQ